MRITIICEGKTELAFKETLHTFLQTRLPGKMPALKFDVHNGSIPTGEKLKRVVDNLLGATRKPAEAVIGLTDVYPAFADAEDAKSRMRAWVGDESRFHPHVALHDFEAWLLPYWDRISRLFEAGSCRDSYSKPRDAKRILKDADLMSAIEKCPELKSFVNTILGLCDKSQVIP